MKIAIAGGSGFIGTKLTHLLQDEGHDIYILTRQKNPPQDETQATYVTWLTEDARPENHLHDTDVFINLAGVSINKGRWTITHRHHIYTSRMQATDELIRILGTLPEKPATLINASAIGIYPTSLKKEYTESSTPAPNDFLGKTVYDWEQKAKQAEQLGTRACFMRFGVVLGTDGGALPLMTLPYKLFAGGTVGSGKQWVSWVHVTDVVRAIAFAIKHEEISGPVNVVAPNPHHMKKVGKTIASVLRRPHWVPAPSPAMKLALGKKSKLILEGQHVKPNTLTQAGFTFTYPTLRSALENLL